MKVFIIIEGFLREMQLFDKMSSEAWRFWEAVGVTMGMLCSAQSAFQVPYHHKVTYAHTHARRQTVWWCVKRDPVVCRREWDGLQTDRQTLVHVHSDTLSDNTCGAAPPHRRECTFTFIRTSYHWMTHSLTHWYQGLVYVRRPNQVESNRIAT